MVHVSDHSKEFQHKIIQVTKAHGDMFGGFVFIRTIFYHFFLFDKDEIQSFYNNIIFTIHSAFEIPHFIICMHA